MRSICICWMLLIGLFLPKSLAVAAVPEATSSPPNIVLILADDFGYECVKANGGNYDTPHLDRLAAQGIRFENCHALPLCTPSRVQLLTGRYNFRNYVRFGEFNYAEKTFAHLLKDAGYATAIAGKWQLAGGTNGPHRAGFDQYCLWQIEVQDKGSRYANPKIIQNGTSLTGMENRYGPDVFADFLLQFIEKNQKRPFLVYWPMVLTHSPFEPTPDSLSKTARNHPRHFPDMVRYLDKNVGRLVAQLENLKLTERTIIIFTGDNGTGRPIASTLNGKPFQGGKGTTTDAGTHVPLIASWRGKIPAAQVNWDLIDFSDFLPTLMEVSGAKLPSDRVIDGKSFLPQLLGKKGEPRAWSFTHYEPRQNANGKRSRFARNLQFKLYDDGRFFDLKKDPEEVSPLSMDEKTTALTRTELQGVLDKYAKEPSFKPAPQKEK